MLSFRRGRCKAKVDSSKHFASEAQIYQCQLKRWHRGKHMAAWEGAHRYPRVVHW